MSAQDERCANRGCNRLLAGIAVITTKDGRRFCKMHGDGLPPYVRMPTKANHKFANFTHARVATA